VVASGTLPTEALMGELRDPKTFQDRLTVSQEIRQTRVTRDSAAPCVLPPAQSKRTLTVPSGCRMVRSALCAGLTGTIVFAEYIGTCFLPFHHCMKHAPDCPMYTTCLHNRQAETDFHPLDKCRTSASTTPVDVIAAEWEAKATEHCSLGATGPRSLGGSSTAPLLV
jgi:hypothetical protein